MFKMSDQGPRTTVSFPVITVYLGFELSFCSMDFPADITLRKTRMKFELTFKVVFVIQLSRFFSFLLRKLLYFITSLYSCQETFLKNFFHLLSKIFAFCNANFYMLSHDSNLSRSFFIFF